MALVRGLFSLAVILVVLVLGYWLYATYVTAPNAPYWSEINTNMPGSFRRFSCEQVRKRETAGQIASCEGV